MRRGARPDVGHAVAWYLGVAAKGNAIVKLEAPQRETGIDFTLDALKQDQAATKPRVPNCEMRLPSETAGAGRE